MVTILMATVVNIITAIPVNGNKLKSRGGEKATILRSHALLDPSGIGLGRLGGFTYGIAKGSIKGVKTVKEDKSAATSSSDGIISIPPLYQINKSSLRSIINTFFYLYIRKLP
jgi:hypothetical protein